MDKQTIEHDGLFFNIELDDMTSTVDAPANRLETEVWCDVRMAEIEYHFPNHNPEDYSYGLFTEN